MSFSATGKVISKGTIEKGVWGSRLTTEKKKTKSRRNRKRRRSEHEACTILLRGERDNSDDRGLEL